jgi:predicted dehydrogenase
MSSNKPVRLGIIGYGFSATVFHLPFIVPNKDLEVHAFLQRDPSLLLQRVPSMPSRAEQDAQLDLSAISPTRTRRASLSTDVFPRAKRYRTADDFFADEDIEFVIVCSRDDTHAEFAERALKAGKHVAVEKPFARSVEEADRVIALAKERGLLVTCFQNRRWDSDFLTLKKLISEGALGKVVDAQMHYDFEKPKWIEGWTEKEFVKGSGKGMMYGLGSHSIDQTIVLFGRPKSVTGFLRSLRGVESEVEDTFTIVLQYDGQWKDLIVTVKTTVVTVLRDPIKYIIRGTGGSYIKVSTPLRSYLTAQH